MVSLHNKYSKHKISKKEINDIITKMDDYSDYLKKNYKKVLKGKKIMKKYGIKVKGKTIEDIAFKKEDDKDISKKEKKQRMNNIYKKYKADDIEGVLNNMSDKDYNKIPKDILYKDPPDIEDYIVKNYKKFK